jgi:hypothetical protein
MNEIECDSWDSWAGYLLAWILFTLTILGFFFFLNSYLTGQLYVQCSTYCDSMNKSVLREYGNVGPLNYYPEKCWCSVNDTAQGYIIHNKK